MPLLDHFRPPLRQRLAWESLHSSWATRIADDLNEHWLPDEYVAAEFTEIRGRLEIDVTTYEVPDPDRPESGGGVAVATRPRARAWTAPPPTEVATAVFPDSVEVRIMHTAEGNSVVAAIELVSPSNKDRPAERRAFVAKCAGYLASGVGLVVVDVVTTKHFNLHAELADLLEFAPPRDFPADCDLYAVAYRPAMRGGRAEIDVWAYPLAVGGALPTMPLRLVGDTFVPVELEATYTEACRRRRLT